MSRFNVASQYPLQPREQNYMLDTKHLTIHSEDRDIKKWPNSNHFEIILPQAYQNVQSMRIDEVNLPVNYYTFSNYLQNTKFEFSLIPKNNSGTDPFYVPLLANANGIYTVEIQEGFYCPCEIINEIQNKMNKVVTKYLNDLGITGTYDRFKVYYDNVGQKVWFGNSVDEFTLQFGNKINYILKDCGDPVIWDRYTKWGLPSYIGYDKKSYVSTSDISAIEFDYTSPPTVFVEPLFTGYPVYFVKAPMTIKILGDSTIYIEVDKYNKYDELMPYPERTSNMYNNDYNGRVNSAFTKIPVYTVPHGQSWSTWDAPNLSVFDPPLERIQKLKFKFRYHDGRLVDFQDFPFNLTITFYMFRNTFDRKMKVAVPTTLYNGATYPP